MTYDLMIYRNLPGIVTYVPPENVTTGTHKLLQRVIAVLFDDDGELIGLIGGKANEQSVSDGLITREIGRTAETISNDTPFDAPDSEKLASLDLIMLNHSGKGVNLNLSIESENSDIISTVINI